MSVAAGVVKVVAGPGRCPAIDADTGRCTGKATDLAEVKTQWGSTYIKACPFHADKMEDE